MRIKGDQESGQSLSRKELQCLCKRYSLPANKSSSEMAKSLASHFEKNLSSLSPRERLCGTQEASLPTFLMSGLQPEAPLNSPEDARKDGKGLNYCSKEEGSRRKCSQTVKINELGYFACDKTYDKEGHGCSIYCFQETSNPPFLSQRDRNDLNRKESPTTILCKNYSGMARDCKMEGMHQSQHTDVNFVSSPEENVLPSSMRMFETVSSSSFEFYVHSEDGINLCVDLNSNPSDWIGKLKSEVNICENIGHNKSRSFHKELGRFGESNKQINSSFPWTVDADQIKDDHVQSASSPSTFMKENNHVELNHQDGGDGSLTSTAIEPSSIAVVVSENLLEDQGVNSSEPNSDARDDIHSCTDENGCMTTLDSDAVNTPRKALAGNSVVNVSDCSISIGTQENQKSKSSNVTCEYSAPENSCSLVNSQVVTAGGTAGDSMEIPPSEAAVQQKDAFCKNGESLDLVDPKGNDVTEQGGLADSRQSHLDICRKHLPSADEEWESIEHIDGVEGSECVQFEDSFEKTCSRLDDVESNELSRKRPNIEIEDQNGCGKPDAKVLRSTKHFAGEVLPRRSMRLVSK
ncbi:hypothetical protein ACOSQ2_006438 [Xanthoceras sorbifolium]